MQVHYGIHNVVAEFSQSICCLGTFDGVHLGHQKVIASCVRIARELGLPSCLVTFDRHPASILSPSKCPPAILSLQRKLERFQALGVDLSVVLSFDQDFSQVSAEQFLDGVLINGLKAKAVVVGHDFAMGKDRVGDTEWLQAKISTQVISPYEVDGHRVSSSLVRNLVLQGDLTGTSRLLGQPFEIEGIVISGDRLGRTLGYPTANLARSFRQVTPPDGVYVAKLSFSGDEFSAALSIGTRPTVSGKDLRIEAYCLDYGGDEFYGRSCRVQLFEMLRPQLKFETLDQLKVQMAQDVREVRQRMIGVRSGIRPH